MYGSAMDFLASIVLAFFAEFAGAPVELTRQLVAGSRPSVGVKAGALMRHCLSK